MYIKVEMQGAVRAQNIRSPKHDDWCIQIDRKGSGKEESK